MKDRITVGGVRLAVEIQGDGAPLLLLNGIGLDMSSWAPQVAALARSNRVIAFDARGAGRSDAPPGPYSTAQMAADALGLLDALGVQRAHVLGFSMGGLVAQRLAAGWPERVESLVLAASAARLPPRARHVIDLWSRLLQAGVEREILLRVQFAWVFSERLLADTATVTELIEALASLPGPSPVGFAGQAAACLDHDATGLLERIVAPCLVLAGREDALLPVPVSEALARAIPGARLAVLDGGGHAFTSEVSGAFNEAVLRFLGAQRARP